MQESGVVLSPLLLGGEVLSIHFFFYLAVGISIPCLLVALVTKHRKRAAIPPMIASLLSAVIYSYAFTDFFPEAIFFWEALVSIVICALACVLYVYSPKPVVA